jgi:hypothetical protein
MYISYQQIFEKLGKQVNSSSAMSAGYPVSIDQNPVSDWNLINFLPKSGLVQQKWETNETQSWLLFFFFLD